jgi:NAD-dependent SIR2 family protein deacetylase
MAAPAAPSVSDRLTVLGPGLAAIPERLLLAHARGEVLFITGAGTSQPAGLPDFRGLVVDTYEHLDAAVHKVIAGIPRGVIDSSAVPMAGLTDPQMAEVRRFVAGDYDVALGLLERRMDSRSGSASSVRHTISNILRDKARRPSDLHRALMRLSDRGGVTTIVTTNFDTLLEQAKQRPSVQSYSVGGIPRPGRSNEFSGVLHIHGALERNPARTSNLIVTDQDFGEFYLRRRAVPDFIYDAARLFHLVLVGYSANDPPMRYLLNAVAADGTRFDDLKERFTFFGMGRPDAVALEDWKGRGITPIPYDAVDDHSVLRSTLDRWSRLSAINGSKTLVDAEIRRIVRQTRQDAPDSDKDLFDHLFRRGNSHERLRLANTANKAKAGFDWIDAADAVLSEREHR